MQPQYDILLKGGHVIDPQNNLDQVMDVAVTGDRIVTVAADIDPALAQTVVDVSGLYVTPGLIDIHVHAYHTREPEGLSVVIDHHSFRSGVTTVVDTDIGRETFSALQAHGDRRLENADFRADQHRQVGHDRRF